MNTRSHILAASLATLTIPAAAQDAPVAVAPVAAAPASAEQAREAYERAAATRAAAAKREEEEMSKPVGWREMELPELEQALGGRTMLEVKAQNATLEQVADLMRGQAQLDIRTRAQILPHENQGGGRGDERRFSFEVSKRPFWEAVRAMGIAQAARQTDGAPGMSFGGGRSIFGDLQGPSGQLFPSFGPSLPSSLSLSSVFVYTPAPQPIAAGLNGAQAQAQAQAQVQVSQPQISATSPRLSTLWQLSDGSSGYSGYSGYSWGSGEGDLSRGRAHSSWPCLFVAEYIGRKQENTLGPDAGEAPAKTGQPPAAKPEEDKAVPAPRVVGDGGAMLGPDKVVLNEWKQQVATTLRAYMDPRLRTYRNVRFVIDEASDEAGRDLRRADFRKPRRLKLSQSPGIEMPIALELGREHGDKLRLRGALLFWVPARPTTIEVALDAEGKASREGVFFGQGAGMKLSLSRGEDKKWLLSSQVEVKGQSGQLDFRREMGPALRDDENYMAGLMLPGTVRVQSEDGCEWKLRPSSEDQQLSLNAGERTPSFSTNSMGSFRRARNATGYFDGNITMGSGGTVTGGGWGGSGTFAYIAGSQGGMQHGPDGRPLQPFAVPTVTPDGYIYTENVTWQLEPSGACGEGQTNTPGGTPNNTPGGALPAITKIIFDAPQEWRQVRVPFELRDLPLPPR